MNKRKVNQLAYEIVSAGIKVHNALGPGLLESIYEKCLEHELHKRGHKVVSQKVIPISYDG